MGETKDVVNLDVTGERISVKRTTLQMCTDSALARKFDDETWTQHPQGASGADSDDEYVQIDFSAYCFGKIVDHLRLVALAGGLEANVAAPVVRADQRDNFGRLVKYYFPGNEDMFLRARTEIWPVKEFGVAATQDESSNSTIISCLPGQSGFSYAVGGTCLVTNAAWKVKLAATATPSKSWALAGVIGDPSPSGNVSYTDSTSYGWGGAGQVYMAGKSHQHYGGWQGWNLNDEAILKLDASNNLKMWHKRTSKLYTITLPARPSGWYLYFGLHNSNTRCMHVMQASVDEAALVQ